MRTKGAPPLSQAVRTRAKGSSCRQPPRAAAWSRATDGLLLSPHRTCWRESEQDFANQIVTDHQAADERVRSYAGAHDIDLDTLQRRLAKRNEDRLELERRAKALGTATGEWAWTWENAIRSKNTDDQTLETLRTLEGPAFDREFVRAMVDGHQKVIDRLTNVRDRRIDPDLRKLIDDLLPSFKRHLEMAQALQDVVSKA